MNWDALRQFFENAIAISSILATLTLLVSISLTFYLLFVKNKEFILKLICIFGVISLCFMASSPWVYGIVVFIISTSITSLEFLENLAAIFMKNKELFDYRAKTATPIERIRKTEEEVQSILRDEVIDAAMEPAGQTSSKEIQTAADTVDGFQIPSKEAQKKVEEFHVDNPAVKSSARRNMVREALDFEEEVFAMLSSENGLFPAHHIIRGVKYQTKNSKIIFDGIADGPLYDYVIEVKYIQTRSVLRRAVQQIWEYLDFYNNVKRIENTSGTRGLLIIPSNKELPSIIDNTIGILEFDVKNKFFKNLNEISNWVNLMEKGFTGIPCPRCGKLTMGSGGYENVCGNCKFTTDND